MVNHRRRTHFAGFENRRRRIRGEKAPQEGPELAPVSGRGEKSSDCQRFKPGRKKRRVKGRRDDILVPVGRLITVIGSGTTYYESMGQKGGIT